MQLCLSRHTKKGRLGMDIKLINFQREHLRYIEYWEKEGDIYNYLSHGRPHYLRDNDPAGEEQTKLYMLKIDGRLVGCAWLEEIDPVKSSAKLGIYLGEARFRGRGLGQYSVNLILYKAFQELNMEKVFLRVREKNTRAINCYKKCGFKITRELPVREFPNGSSESAYEMQITKNKWRNKTKKR